MKKRMLSLIALAVLSITMVFAQTGKKEKFKVAGNCDMCEKRIEEAAKSVNGIFSADWDKETKILVVVFDTLQTGINKVHTALAEAGHDTEVHKAIDEAYFELPGCCKYERMSKILMKEIFPERKKDKKKLKNMASLPAEKLL